MSLVRLFDHDPSLGDGLTPVAFESARVNAVVPSFRLPRGRWHPEADAVADGGFLGLLVLDGVLTHTTRHGGGVCTELLGPGDVLRQGHDHRDTGLPTDLAWQVRTTSASIAVLDRNFARVAMRWPELAGTLAERMHARTHALAVQMATSHLRRVDLRVLATLWQQAERFGFVRPEGVVVGLPLTHQLLAELVGARRPSVTLALGQLEDAGRVSRAEAGLGYMLHDRQVVAPPLVAAVA